MEITRAPDLGLKRIDPADVDLPPTQPIDITGLLGTPPKDR